MYPRESSGKSTYNSLFCFRGAQQDGWFIYRALPLCHHLTCYNEDDNVNKAVRVELIVL